METNKRDMFERPVSPQVFLSMLFQSFKSYVEANPANEIDCIRHSLRLFSPYLQYRNLGDIYLEFVFSLIEVFRSTNSVVIQNTLENYFVRLLKYYNYDIEMEIKAPSPLRPITMHDVHYEVVPGCKKKFSIDSFFYQTSTLRNISVMKKLLRYGVKFEMDDEVLHTYQDDSVLPHLISTGMRKFTEVDDNQLIQQFNELYDTFDKRKRLYFIFLVLEIMYLKQIGCIKYYEISLKSLRLLFKTILDPLIAVEELYRLFDYFVEGENKDKVKNYCDIFLEDFPKGRQPFQPRRLKHISRYHVREALIKAKKLPHGVWSIEIPKKVQNYILIQENEDEFYPEYVSALSTNKRSASNTPDPKRQDTLLK